MKKIIILLLIAQAGFAILQAQIPNQTMNINAEIRVDSTGNALHSLSGKLTAQQWLFWNYMYGGGQASMVKKNFERMLSPYYVYNFKYSPNEMDRTFSIEYNAKGVVEYLGRDKWVANLGLKDVQPVKTSENAFTAVQSQLNGNIVVQTNTKVSLPSNATNMSFDKDEFGNVTVQYKMPTETVVSFGSTPMKITGFSLMGIGAVSLLALIFLRRKN